MVRLILKSLTHAYADSIRALEDLAGREIETVHITGGGSPNAMLCQLTADAIGRPVLAGPV